MNKEYNNITEDDAKKELEKGYAVAEELIKDPSKTEEFLQRLENKLKVIPKVGNTLAMVPLLISMIRSYIRGEYKKVPIGTIVAILSALLYVFAPVDLIPDFIFGAGYIDDALVLGTCLKLVQSDLDEFVKYRDKKNENK